MKKCRLLLAFLCLGFAFEMFGSEDGLTVKQRMELVKQREKDAQAKTAAVAAKPKRGGGGRSGRNNVSAAVETKGGGASSDSRSASPEGSSSDDAAPGLAGGGSKVKEKKLGRERKLLRTEGVDFVESVYKDFFSQQFNKIQNIVKKMYVARKDVPVKKDKMEIANKPEVLMPMTLSIRKILQSIQEGQSEEDGLHAKMLIVAQEFFQDGSIPEDVVKTVSKDENGQSSIADIAAGVAWSILLKMFDVEDQRIAASKYKKDINEEQRKNDRVAMEIARYTSAGITEKNARQTVNALYAETQLEDMKCIANDTLPAIQCSTCRRGYNEKTKKWHVGYLPLSCDFSKSWSTKGYDNGEINGKEIPAFTSYATLIDSLGKMAITVNTDDQIMFKNFNEDFQQELTSENDWNIVNMLSGRSYNGYKTIFTVESSSRGSGGKKASPSGMSDNQGVTQGVVLGGGKKAKSSSNTFALNNMLAARVSNSGAAAVQTPQAPTINCQPTVQQGGGVAAPLVPQASVVASAQAQPVQQAPAAPVAQPVAVVQQVPVAQPAVQGGGVAPASVRPTSGATPAVASSSDPAADLQRLHQMLSELNQQAQSA